MLVFGWAKFRAVVIEHKTGAKRVQALKGRGDVVCGGDGGVFGSSTRATIFSRDVPGVSEMNVFSGSQWKQSDLNQGLRGVFGAPVF